MPGAAPDISVTIACLNEEENVEAIAAAVAHELEQKAASYEIIFIDNASSDRTVELVKAMAAKDTRIKLIVNRRNFGQMRSPTHAIYSANGRAVISMCADFQDSPSLIGQFVDRWRAGGKIILGVRESEGGSQLKRAYRAIGYELLSRFGDYRVIPNATGFGLYDREVVDCLARWNEPEPFVRGMLVECGFPIETIPYKRPERAAGKSKNDLLRLLDFFLSGIAGSSKKLLRLPFALAGISLMLAAATLIAGAVFAVYGRSPGAVLWDTVIEFQFAGLFLFLGLLGDQVRLISERTRNVPLVIEKERVNLGALEE